MNSVQGQVVILISVVRVVVTQMWPEESLERDNSAVDMKERLEDRRKTMGEEGKGLGRTRGGARSLNVKEDNELGEQRKGSYVRQCGKGRRRLKIEEYIRGGL